MPGDDFVSTHAGEPGHFVEIRAVIDHGHVDNAIAFHGDVADVEVVEEGCELGHGRLRGVDHHE